MSDLDIEGALKAVTSSENRKIVILYRQLRRELRQPRDGLNSVWFNPNVHTKVGDKSERVERVYVSRIKQLKIKRRVPVLVLDGTGSITLNRRMFGERMVEHRFAVPRDAEVIQVTSKSFSRQSLTGCDRNDNPISDQKMAEATRLRAQIVDFLRSLPGAVLLVSYKQAEELLKPHLPPHVKTAHFGAVRGLNSFEHCETVVVVGRNQTSTSKLERDARAFMAEDAEGFAPAANYRRQWRGRRMRGESSSITSVEVHPDPRCQDVLEQMREAETMQAVDRVRPVFNRRRIFLLTDLALDVTVDRTVTWPELQPSVFDRAFARHGVLPLSSTDLSRCFPVRGDG